MHTIETLKRIFAREQDLGHRRRHGHWDHDAHALSGGQTPSHEGPRSHKETELFEAKDPKGPLKHPLKRITDSATGFEYWVRRKKD